MEKRNCKNCNNSFEITDTDQAFYNRIDVPMPTLCVECRYRRRLLDRNEWSLYKRKCDLTGEDIVSIYREDAPFPVYKPKVWQSDEWDALDFGRDFDFSRGFFEQYHELRQEVPHLALVDYFSVNCHYSNQSQDNKDCYWVSATNKSEKCIYGNWFQAGNHMCADCYMIQYSELCYESMNCTKCFKCVWCEDCFDCSNMSFSIDCVGCSDCFGCVGLRNKSYCYFNEQLTKEEYEKRISEFNWTRKSIEDVQEKMRDMVRRFPRKQYHGRKVHNATGDYLENADNAQLAFNCREIKDSAYHQDSWEVIDSWDCTEILGVELSYELQGCAHIRNSISIRSSTTLSDCYYCDMCQTLNNCFGCFGLRGREYCILNKQYTKEEYFDFKGRIIEHMKKLGEWGEYYPSEHSPFAYNESVAQDFFPLTKEEALKNGEAWHKRPERDVKQTMRSDELPESISQTGDDILNQVIECYSQTNEEEKKSHPLCTTMFRLIPLELEIYRKLGIPVPKKCFPCRRTDRFAKRNPRRTWKRGCGCSGAQSENGLYNNHIEHFHGGEHCPNEFETSYAPDRKEIIYCEQCYNTEVV